VLARAYNSEHQVKGPSIDSFLDIGVESPSQMELINECSQRFAEDKDYRLIVSTATIRMKPDIFYAIKDCRQYNGPFSR
jgi:hypothetical protein